MTNKGGILGACRSLQLMVEQFEYSQEQSSKSSSIVSKSRPAILSRTNSKVCDINDNAITIYFSDQFQVLSTNQKFRQLPQPYVGSTPMDHMYHLRDLFLPLSVP